MQKFINLMFANMRGCAESENVSAGLIILLFFEIACDPEA